jgi:hypothetical protein
MTFGELVDGARSQGGEISQWKLVVSQDMTDFGWITVLVPTGADVSEAAATKMHHEYSSGRWKEIIAHDTPSHGNGCLRMGTFASWTIGLPTMRI